MKKILFGVFVLIFTLFTAVCAIAYDEDEAYVPYDWDNINGNNLTLVKDVPEPAYEYTKPEITSPLAEYVFGNEKCGCVNLYSLTQGKNAQNEKSASFVLVSDNFDADYVYFRKGTAVLKRYTASSLLGKDVLFEAEGTLFYVTAVRDGNCIYFRVAPDGEKERAEISLDTSFGNAKIFLDANPSFYKNNKKYVIAAAFYNKNGALTDVKLAMPPFCALDVQPVEDAVKMRAFALGSFDALKPAANIKEYIFK